MIRTVRYGAQTIPHAAEAGSLWVPLAASSGTSSSDDSGFIAEPD